MRNFGTVPSPRDGDHRGLALGADDKQSWRIRLFRNVGHILKRRPGRECLCHLDGIMKPRDSFHPHPYKYHTTSFPQSTLPPPHLDP